MDTNEPEDGNGAGFPLSGGLDTNAIDACRYRWLRKEMYEENGMLELGQILCRHSNPNYMEIDSAIDAAMDDSHDCRDIGV